jgi:hypothetical protein
MHWYIKPNKTSPTHDDEGHLFFSISIRKAYIWWIYLKLFFTYFIPRLFKKLFKREPTLSNGKEVAFYKKNDEGE